MKKLLSIALLASLGFSAGFTVMPYGSYINYTDNTIKDKAYDTGVYTSYFTSPFKLEMDGEYLDLKYKNNSNVNDYIEKDLTFVGNYFIKSNYKIKAGIRNMYINQKNNNDKYDKTLILGMLYYKYLKYNGGIETFYSTYDGFNVKQLTPHIGYYFGNYYSTEGLFYAEAKLNYIHISDRKKAGTKLNNYLNTDLKLVNSQGPWATTLKASVGKNVYKVSNGGFIVYNLGEEYHYGFGLDVSYKIDKNTSLKVGYTRSRFDENNKKAYSNVFVASYSLSF